MKPSTKLVCISQKIDYLVASLDADLLQDEDCLSGFYTFLRDISEDIFKVAKEL